MGEFSYLLTLVVLLLGVAVDPASAQQTDFGGQDLSVGESEYDTSPSVADDLERDLSAGDDEYDTPLAPDPPAMRPSIPSNDQTYVDNGPTYVDSGQAEVDSTAEWSISKDNMIWAGVFASIGVLCNLFLWFLAEINT